MIKAAFFDLDDTLCDDSSAWIACARKAAAAGEALVPKELDLEAVAQQFLAISEVYWTGPEYTTETRSIHQLRVDQFCEALGNCGVVDVKAPSEAMAAEYSRTRSRDIELFPDALSTLEALRERGVKLALITNGLVSTHVEKVEHLGLEAAFDHVVIADAVGLWKPDQRIFAHALELCGAAPSDAVMVGDNIANDVAGAQDAGIPAFWYNPNSLPLPQGASSPILGELRRLTDLLSVPGFAATKRSCGTP
ncbi:MAG TPA: HAD family hydrolase [Capsulimonadaceae bacterium]|jgi:putative hydrolase of the HAD superfamily